MAKTKTRVHDISAKTGKPPGMNYADFLAWRKMIYEEAREAAVNELNRVLADRQAQRMEWLYIVALGEREDFTPRQAAELEATVKAMAAEYRKSVEENGQDYADEDLRRRVSQVRGHEVQYLYEDQYPVNQALNGEDIAALREAASRIY